MNDPVDNKTHEIPGMEALPRSMRPGRDLWPGIAARLSPMTGVATAAARRGWQGLAVAASVALALTVGILLGRQTGGPGPGVGIESVSSLAMQAAREGGDREYLAAFREFLLPVNTAGGALETLTAESIEGSWAELQQAEIALRAALREYPHNIYLNRKLLDLQSQQLAFMKQIATLDQFSRRKI
jgi:hypothetical protein